MENVKKKKSNTRGSQYFGSKSFSRSLTNIHISNFLPKQSLIALSLILFNSLIRMSELPFRPREKLFEKQRYFQSAKNYTHLKGPYDKITTVAIPLAFTVSSIFMITRGIYNMSNGIGKKE